MNGRTLFFGLSIILITAILVPVVGFNLRAEGIANFERHLDKEQAAIQAAELAFNESQWGLEQILAHKTWEYSKGRPEVIVAVIDTGVDINHSALRQSLWKNSGERGIDELGRDKSHNGVDDDHNGYVDDVYGWNFAANSNDILDKNGHGTHIAGIIAAKSLAPNRVMGVAPGVKLMILKYYDPVAVNDHVKNTVKAIEYATQMGAHIINYSAGGSSANPSERLAIKKAGERGILFVAAAGNESSNSDESPYYPADYKLPNILSVTAINSRNQVLDSSNYGLESVDLAAPGNRIYSTLPNNKYGFMTGTSQATAFASGVAALMLSHHQNLKRPEDLISRLNLTGSPEKTLQNLTKFRAKLNSHRALGILDRSVSSLGKPKVQIDDSSTLGGLIDFNKRLEIYLNSKEIPKSP